MNKLIFSFLALVLAATAAYANPGAEMKASPLFAASLENSLARLEGNPEPAEESMATEASDCPSPDALLTTISTCSPTVCGSSYTCYSTCSSTCGSTCASTCSGNTCGSTCVGGNCANYRFKGGHKWQCNHAGPHNVWTYRGPPAYLPDGLPHGMFLDDDGTKIKWNDEGSWRDIGIFDVGDGSYDKTYTRTTTSTSYQIKGWIVYWDPNSWRQHTENRSVGSTSSTNTNNFTHPLVW